MLAPPPVSLTSTRGPSGSRRCSAPTRLWSTARRGHDPGERTAVPRRPVSPVGRRREWRSGLFEATTNQISSTYDPDGTPSVSLHKYSVQGVDSDVPAGMAGGDPLVDADGGTIRFYARDRAQNLLNRRPSISSYRYVGAFGVDGNPVLFDTGMQATAAPAALRPQGDSNRQPEFSTIADGSQALQFGGDHHGVETADKEPREDACRRRGRHVVPHTNIQVGRVGRHAGGAG